MSKICTCYQDLLADVKAKKVEEGEIPHNALEVRFNWENQALVFSFSGETPDYAPVSPKIEYSFREIKKSGEPHKNLTRKTVSVFGSYCTFCGRKYNKEHAANEPVQPIKE